MITDITKEQFQQFLNELSGHLDDVIKDYECPFLKYESEWYNEHGFNPPPYCDVSFTKDYYGEIDQVCSKGRGDCWINYVLRMYDLGEFNATPIQSS